MEQINEKQILIAFFDILGTSRLLNTGEKALSKDSGIICFAKSYHARSWVHRRGLNFTAFSVRIEKRVFALKAA